MEGSGVGGGWGRYIARKINMKIKDGTFRYVGENSRSKKHVLIQIL